MKSSKAQFRWLLALVVALLALVAAHTAGQAQSAGFTVTYSSGWNLVAGPRGTILTGAAGSLFTFQGTDSSYESFPATTPLQPLLGYWAFFPTSATLTLSPAVPQTTTTSLLSLPRNHYVMIGNPFTVPITLSGADQILVYNAAQGQYVATATLQPGQGAWAFSQSGGTLTAATLGAVATATPPPAPTATPSTGLQLTLVQSYPQGAVPPGAAGSPPNTLVYYTFHIGGVDLTNQAIGSGNVAVQPNVLSLWGRFTTDPNLIYVGILPTAASGPYTVTVALPGGQTVSTTFMVSASVGTTGNIQLSFVQSYPAGTVPPGAAGSPSNTLSYYVFRIGGVDLTNQSAGTVTVLPNVSFGWGRFTTDSNLIYVGIIATAPSGTYTVTVTLPSGQTASATFTH